MSNVRTGKCNGWQGTPLFAKDPCELFGKMHRIAKTSAISRDEEFASILKTLRNPFAEGMNKLHAMRFFQVAYGAQSIIYCILDLIVHGSLANNFCAIISTLDLLNIAKSCVPFVSSKKRKLRDTQHCSSRRNRRRRSRDTASS